MDRHAPAVGREQRAVAALDLLPEIRDRALAELRRADEAMAQLADDLALRRAEQGGRRPVHVHDPVGLGIDQELAARHGVEQQLQEVTAVADLLPRREQLARAVLDQLLEDPDLALGSFEPELERAGVAHEAASGVAKVR
jgi:hypothetical protein